MSQGFSCPSRVCFQVTSAAGCRFFPVPALPAPAKAGTVLSMSCNNDSPVPQCRPLGRVNAGIVRTLRARSNWMQLQQQKQSILRSHRDQEHALMPELRSRLKRWGTCFVLFNLKLCSAIFREQPGWVHQLVLTAEMPPVPQRGITQRAGHPRHHPALWPHTAPDKHLRAPTIS